MFWYKWQARPDSTGDTRALSLVDGNWKIIKWIDEDLVELFDLSDDIGEQTNVATAQPERTQAMLATLLETEKSIGNLRERGRKGLEKRLQKAKQKAEQKATKNREKNRNR